MALNLAAVGKEWGPEVFGYDWRDVALYALGLGAGNEDLDFVYEKNMKVYPTFAIVPVYPVMYWIVNETQLDLTMLLHAGQKIELYKEIPPSGKLTSKAKITHIYDKVKSALILTDVETKDESGTPLFTNTISFMVRGAGGFGGDRGPSVPKNVPPEGEKPDFHDEIVTFKDQNVIYRLSGDVNPLHIDPDFAKLAGFDRPILHGLCTFGVVGRSTLRKLCNNEVGKMKSFDVRFTGVVYPRDTIITEGWKMDGNQYLIQARNQQGAEVISAVTEIR